MRVHVVRKSIAHLVLAAGALTSELAFADAPTSNDAALSAATSRDAKGEAPIVAYAYQAYGAPARTLGAQGYGLGLAGPGQRATGGGGIVAWGSPIDRLTLIVDAPRDVYLLDRFAPSAAAIVRLLGAPADGWSLGALAKYKVEGFGTDPKGDTESELEGGLLLSYVRYGLHFDANAITGFGLTDDGEIDTEGRLRFGYDVSRLVRVGVDGQGRWRLAGTTKLLNGQTWDFAAGPQILIGLGHFFGALTAGPTTMGLTKGGVAGWTVVASLGGSL